MSDEVPVLTDAQRAALGEMIADAFVEIRFVAGLGQAARACDLADVFHNVPKEMFGTTWWYLMYFREDLGGYQKRHADADCRPRDYVTKFDAIFGAQLAVKIKIQETLEALPSLRTGVWHHRDGTVGMLVRIISYPESPAASQEPEGAATSDGRSVHYYVLHGRPDGSQWSLSKTRYNSVREAMEGAVKTLDAPVRWDAY
jgi:hypothetical protein